MSAVITPIRPPAICSICQATFQQRTSWHQLCITCWGWTVAGKHIAEAAAVLRRIQRRG